MNESLKLDKNILKNHDLSPYLICPEPKIFLFIIIIFYLFIFFIFFWGGGAGSFFALTGGPWAKKFGKHCSNMITMYYN